MDPVVSAQVPWELQLFAAHFAPASTPLSVPPELVDELDEDEDVELDVEPPPSPLEEEVEDVELEVPPSAGSVALSPHAATTKPTIRPEAIPILRIVISSCLGWQCPLSAARTEQMKVTDVRS